MKIYSIIICLCIFGLSGCSPLNPDQVLAPEPKADRIEVISQRGREKLVGHISDPSTVAKVVAYVNSLPSTWHTPWPEGAIAVIRLEFYDKGILVGRFAVAPDYFERWSHTDWCFLKATPTQIQELNDAAGMDLLKLASAEH